MKIRILFFCILFISVNSYCDELLSLDAIYSSIDKHHPQILSDQSSIKSKEYLQESALGKFDPAFESASSNYVESRDYDGFTTSNALKLPLDFNFGELRAGHRYTNGDFPSYEDIRTTRDGGEAFLALKISLLRGQETDSRRANLYKTEIESELAKEDLNISRLELRNQALTLFSDYYAAQAAQNVFTDLLKVAEARGKQFEEKVKIGDRPEIDIAENERLIAQRRAMLESQKGKLNSLKQELRVFMRNNDGSLMQSFDFKPVLIARNEALNKLDNPYELGKLAAENRPEIRIADLKIKKLGVAKDLAENNILPDLTLGAEVSQDMGSGSEPSDESETKLLLGFEVPFYQREARNQYQSLLEDITAEQHKLRLLIDKINAEIMKLYEQYKASQAQLSAVKSELENSIKLEEAEKIKLDRGGSNLIFLNIREASTAEAKLKLENTKAAIFELQERIRLYTGLF